MVEDEASLREGIVDLLDRRRPPASSRSATAWPASRPGCAIAFDLVVLDLMLPRLDGMEVCRRLRAARPGVRRS